MFCFLFAATAFSAVAAAPIPAFAGGGGWMDYAKAYFLKNPDAQFRIAFLMERNGTLEDTTAVIRLYTKAARAGHAEAANRLALYLEKTNGADALFWHKQAVSKEEAPFSKFSADMHNRSLFHGSLSVIPSPAAASALRLGFLYREGRMGNEEYPLDRKSADEFYHKAFFAGVPAWVIGEIHTLLHHDHKAAVEWYKKEALLSTQIFYRTGLSYEKLNQPDEAAKWYRRILKAPQEAAETKAPPVPPAAGADKGLAERDSAPPFFSVFGTGAGGRGANKDDGAGEGVSEEAPAGGQEASFHFGHYNSARLIVLSAASLEETAAFFSAQDGKQDAAFQAVYQTAAALSLGRLFAGGRLKTGLNMHQALSHFEIAAERDVTNSARFAAAQILQAVWERTKDPADKRLTIDWLTQAKGQKELSPDQFNERLSFLDSSPDGENRAAGSSSCSDEWRPAGPGGGFSDGGFSDGGFSDRGFSDRGFSDRGFPTGANSPRRATKS